MSEKPQKSWLGVVFGVLFALGGAVSLYVTAFKPIVSYISTSGWVEVPASIISVKLKRYHDDSTTYKVEARYTFEYNNDHYSSDRVSLSTGDDSIGDYWQNLFKEIKHHHSQNEVSAFVNPKDPEQSVLDRTLRWKVILSGASAALIFFGVAGFFLWASLKPVKSNAARRQQETISGIPSNQKSSAKLSGIFGAILLLSGAGIAAVALPTELKSNNYGVLLVLIFPLTGAGILHHAYKIHRDYRKFGPTPLYLNPNIPGVGGQLGGWFSIYTTPAQRRSTRLTENFSRNNLTARLICTRKTYGKNNTNSKIIWQAEQPVFIEHTGYGNKGTFIFQLPDHALASSDSKPGYRIDWMMTVEGQLNGLGYFLRDWLVTVEDNTDELSTTLSIPDSFLQQARHTQAQQELQSASSQIPLVENSHSIQIHSRAGRYVKSVLSGILFGSIFMGSGIFTVSQNWWPGYLFVLIGSLISLTCLYKLGKSIVTTIEKDSLSVYTCTRLYGIAISKKSSTLIDEDQIDLKKTSSSQTARKRTEYYDLRIEHGDEAITLATAIKGRDAADRLRDILTERCFTQNSLPKAA